MRATCILGGLLMSAGHLCMAYEATFICGLLLLVVGNGAFKPTISAQLSQLYEPPGPTTLREPGARHAAAVQPSRGGKRGRRAPTARSHDTSA